METTSSQGWVVNPLDLNTVNINEQYERRVWSRSFGITEDQLEKLVSQFGPSAQEIRAYLRQNSNA